VWVLFGRVEESGRTGDEEKVSWFLRGDKCTALEFVIGLEPLLESDVVRYRLQKSSSSRL